MKIKEFQRILRRKGCSFSLLYNVGMDVNPNFYYFTQYSGVGCLIVPARSSPFLIVPKMEFERAKQGLVKKVYELNKKRFFESVADYVATKNKTIAVDMSVMTLAVFKAVKKQFKRVKVVDVYQDLRELRMVKNNKEQGYLKKACSDASSILKKTLNSFKDFKTESEVAAFLEYETKKRGRGLSFPPIVASGKHGSIPHYEPKKVKLQQGLCVIDFGTTYNGYCSDMTRTVAVGKISQKEQEVYNLLLKVQNNTIKQITPRKTGQEIYQYCVDALGEYAEYFTHGLGHGVGAEIHELPNLTLNSTEKFLNGTVFTVEPGVYLPGKFGIRIEDTILMKNNKKQILTRVPKQLIRV